MRASIRTTFNDACCTKNSKSSGWNERILPPVPNAVPQAIALSNSEPSVAFAPLPGTGYRESILIHHMTMSFSQLLDESSAFPTHPSASRSNA
jgi:hypothetical protein